MMVRKLKPISALMLCLALMCPAQALDVDDLPKAVPEFKLGKKFYDQKNYREAQKHLTLAATYASRNASIQYYLGLSAVQNSDLQTLRRTMARIVVSNKNNSEISERALDTLKKYVTSVIPYSAIGSYDRLVRWKRGVPIKIYISDGLMLPPSHRGKEGLTKEEALDAINMFNQGRLFFTKLERDPNYDPGFKKQILAGLARWEWARKEKIFDYQVIESPENADLLVFWAPKLSKGNGGFTANVNYPPTGKKVYIQFATLDPARKIDPRAADNYLAWAAAHEFGHGWGLDNHSLNPIDMMYHKPLSTPGQITENDKLSLRALYDLAPDDFK